MTFALHDRVLTARPASTVGQGVLAYPMTNFVFGTITAIGAMVGVVWDDGVQSLGVAEAAFDKVDSDAVVAPKVVRPVGLTSPEYDSIVVAQYPRVNSGDGTLLGVFMLVRTLGDADVYFEGLVSEFEEVEGR